MPEDTFFATLKEKKEIADAVFALTFQKPDDFSFSAGQFVQFLIPNGEKSVPRSYSIASTTEEEDLLFCVKFLEGGLASTHFKNMGAGDTLEFRGPKGRFICNEAAKQEIFIATGAGLAPIYGMIREELTVKKSQKPMHLLFGVRLEKDIFWTNELDAIAAKYSHFSYTLTLSQPSDTWAGTHGRVTEHLDEVSPDAHTYICGSAAMVKDVRAALLNKKMPGASIHFEIF